jgi:hypothetical protein
MQPLFAVARWDCCVSFAVVVGFSNTLSPVVFGVNEQRWTE